MDKFDYKLVDRQGEQLTLEKVKIPNDSEYIRLWIGSRHDEDSACFDFTKHQLDAFTMFLWKNYVDELFNESKQQRE